MAMPFVTHQGPYQDTYFDLIVHCILISLTFTMHQDQARLYFFAKCPDGTPLMAHYMLQKHKTFKNNYYICSLHIIK